MNNIISIFVNEASKAIEAIKAINKTDAYLALVIDKKERLLGTITDGDIRRGLLKGYTSESNVRKFMNRDFKFITEKDLNKININEVFDVGLKQIPLLDKKGLVIKMLKK